MTRTHPAARPTTYRGIRMRSRLEATFAQHLDAHPLARNGAVTWQYEPEAFATTTGDQYLPDFVITDTAGVRVYVEVRPTADGAERGRQQLAAVHENDPHALCVAVHPCPERWARGRPLPPPTLDWCSTARQVKLCPTHDNAAGYWHATWAVPLASNRGVERAVESWKRFLPETWWWGVIPGTRDRILGSSSFNPNAIGTVSTFDGWAVITASNLCAWREKLVIVVPAAGPHIDRWDMAAALEAVPPDARSIIIERDGVVIAGDIAGDPSPPVMHIDSQHRDGWIGPMPVTPLTAVSAIQSLAPATRIRRQ